MLNLFGKKNILGKILLLPIDKIAPNPNQPRRVFEPTALAGLAQSISQNGLLQPILVTQTDNGYTLIAGERRLMACRQLEWTTIPAIVQQSITQNPAVLALIENLHREDLNFFEEAEAIANLIAQGELSQQEAAQLLCKSQPAIANKLRLLRFPPKVQDAILREGLTERHARALLKFEDEEDLMMAVAYVAEHQLNVAQTEQYVDKMVLPPDKKPISKGVIRDVRLLFNTIAKAVLTVREGGIGVETLQTEDENYISYVVRVPKSGVFLPPGAVEESPLDHLGRL